MTTDASKNEPTWIEMGIAYVFWAVLFLVIYTSVLKPRGYTIGAGINWLKGKSAKVEKKADKDKKKVTAPVMAPEMAPEVVPDMAPAKVQPMASSHPVMRPVHTAPAMKKKTTAEDDD